MHINSMGAYSLFQVLRMPMLGSGSSRAMADGPNVDAATARTGKCVHDSAHEQYFEFLSLFHFQEGKGQLRVWLGSDLLEIVLHGVRAEKITSLTSTSADACTSTQTPSD